MTRLLAAFAVVLAGLLGLPGVAQGYPAPPEPDIDSTEDVITPGDFVVFLLENWRPAARVTVTVSADGVDGADIGLEVLGSTSVVARADAEGSFEVGVTFPEEATYTISATGPDLEGETETVSLTVVVGAGDGDEDGGGDEDGDGGAAPPEDEADGLPQTGTATRGWLVTGGVLLGLGGVLAGGAAVNRRRSAARTRAA